MSMTSGFMAVLQIFDDFTPGALTGLVVSIPIIIYILIGRKYGIYGLAMVSVLGFGMQVLIQIPWLLKNKYKYSFKLNIHDKRIKKMLILVLPVLIGTGVGQLNVLVDRMVASGLPVGSIASFDYAYKLSGIVYSIFVYSIITIIYPNLSKVNTNDNFITFKKYICKSINVICMVMIPASLSMILLQRDIVEIVFKHGAFDEKAVIMTANALGYLAIGMVFLGIRDVCDRAFYSLNDTKTSMINGVIGMVCCIISNLITVRYIGIRGLALSLTLSAVVSTVLLLRSLRKKIGGLNSRKILESNFKIIISSIFMIAFIWVLRQVLSPYFTSLAGMIMLFVIYIVLGITIYVIGIKLLKLEEFLQFEIMMKNKFHEIRHGNIKKDNMA
jgi:putative peptidoglycan lipid II flippase